MRLAVRRWPFAVGLCAILACAPEPAAPPHAEAPKCVAGAGVLCPVDEGERDPSFADYRRRLVAAVDKRDRDALLALVDPHVRTSFGEGGGREEFARNLDHGWAELHRILALGGSFKSESSFWAPYVYANWPESLDAFAHVAATRAGVALREQPSPTARAVRTADWSILELVDNAARNGFRHVKTLDGAAAWVDANDVRSPVGFRAGFNKTEKGWTMTALVAGD